MASTSRIVQALSVLLVATVGVAILSSYIFSSAKKTQVPRVSLQDADTQRDDVAPAARLIDPVGATRSTDRVPKGIKHHGVGEIVFPDGETVVVKPLPMSIGDIPAGPAREIYGILQHAAENGDGEAAYFLFSRLRECSAVPSDKAELAAVVDEIQSTHMISPGADGRKQYVEEITGYLEWLTKRYEDCEGLTREQRGEAQEWLAVSAEAGYLHAKNMYAEIYLLPLLEDAKAVLPGNRAENAVGWLLSARDAGSIRALKHVGFLYASGINVDGLSLKPDPIEAYAHLYAYWKIQQVEGSQDNVQQIAYGLERVGYYLNPYQLDAALDRAKALLRSANCCRWP